ncbi:sugar phosphate isomerase/epimerase [Frankia sp. CNm7]|uniref:Sugar phosphate isomerase/epimerase n=1 Tax=Frankia nepalensis TaxID=1836974 RepID=A0A937RMH3_9ACTN|nr:sugar phosphate isomerase/epimerase family protein [Frankia nepalensis]MBL7500185.1 sugar phosphate isomerase/epimerase [Frankia nepalensis]MBL7509435.1 sugar phosphate isomerase/epimerase [Frankia nepalensis]MBL7524807.1 sugar phosphate isomerase/epimerase [Frankia nepalensis]MBL7631615.1 sugar phosphate isomerase/epimerase [Frankia nepalensis]
MAVEIALTPDSRREIDVPGLVGAAAGAGFTAVGLAAGRADAAGAKTLAAAGTRCHELLALLVGDDAEATLAQAGQLAEAAATVGARWVLAGFRAGLSAETAPVIRRCAEMLAEAGAGLAVEFSPLGPVGTISAAREVVAAAGAERSGVLIDTWHFFRGKSTWAELSAIPLDEIAYIQFDDAPPPVGSGFSETLHRRVMPGDGEFDLERFASTLLERGFDGLVSVEVLSAELRQLPVPEFCRLAHASTARYWR